MSTTKTEIEYLKSSLEPDQEQQKRRQRLYIIVIVILLIIVCIASVIRVLFPPKVQIRESAIVTTNADLSRTVFTSIQYTGEDPNLPQELPIARQSPESLSNQEAIDALINRHQLVRKSIQLKVWANDNYLLTYDSSVDKYTLLVSGYDSSEVIPIVERSLATSTAQGYLNTLLPSNQLTLLENAVTFHHFGQEITDTSENEATAVRVPFAPTLQGIPVYFEQYADYPFIVTVDGKNEIRRIVFHPQLQKYEVFDTLPLITIEEALENMKQGKSSIITAKYLEEEPIQLRDLKSAQLSSVQLEYRDDTSQGLIYPFYRFTGKATRADDKGVELQIITPAVHTTSLR